jgi:type I restriction-modification system DNA methylase subunit
MEMSKQYSCDLCKKVFNQKIDFTRHKNKKAPCITLIEMQEINQTKEVKMDNKTTLVNTFNNIMDLLRDNEALVGPKALLNWIPLLILKMIEPHFGNEINIDDYQYDFSHIEDVMIEKHKNKLLEIVRFSNLSNEKEDNIPVNMKYLWDDILSNHPTTKNIFLKGKHLLIKNKSTYKKVIDKINTINLNVDNDILGDAYEEIFKNIMIGKTFGQFFTPPSVKNIMVKLINPQIHPDGKIDTCGDPTMGTGGFLIEYLRNILQQAKSKNIKPDWDFIKTEGLYGKELDEDTYQLAVSNMLISSGHMFENLERGDSIREPITRKFDNILANPPFGIKTLTYDDFQTSLKNEYIPIKTDNAVSLFIQAIIYMLKINGKCAVVLPDGQDLFSKTNTTLVAIREYLMKTCDLKEIIYLPSGIFIYVSIKTCVFYFVKKREGTDVLETKIKISKTQKERGRDYKFSKTHQTTKVKFYDYNPYEDIKNLLVEVPIEKIVSNSYSLNYAEYMKDETEEEQYEEGVVVKTLGQVCSIDYGTRIVRKDNVEGEYPVYGSGRAMFSTQTFNREGFNILVGRFALSLECVRFVNEKIFLNDSGLSVKPKTDILLHKYIGYYLLHNQNIIYNCARGTAQKNIEMDIFKSIKIPIPSLERQQDIVKYLDFIYEKANKTSNEKIAELKQLNEFCLSNQKIFGDNVVKTLRELCNFLPKSKRQASYGEKHGEYPFYTSSQSCSKYCDEYDYEDESLIIGTGGNANIKYSSKFSCSTDNFVIKINPGQLVKYIYYYLSINIEVLQKGFIGVGLQHISKEYINNIKIQIPSLERQKEIVEYCEYNDTLIKQLQKEIENNKKQAQQFIAGIVKVQVQTEEQSDTSSVNIQPIDEVKNEIVSVEEEVVIEPKPKVKKNVKKSKKEKKIIVIVEEDNEV